MKLNTDCFVDYVEYKFAPKVSLFVRQYCLLCRATRRQHETNKRTLALDALIAPNLYYSDSTSEVQLTTLSADVHAAGEQRGGHVDAPVLVGLSAAAVLRSRPRPRGAEDGAVRGRDKVGAVEALWHAGYLRVDGRQFRHLNFTATSEIIPEKKGLLH